MSEKISKGVLYGMLLNVNVAEAVADVNSTFCVVNAVNYNDPN